MIKATGESQDRLIEKFQAKFRSEMEAKESKGIKSRLERANDNYDRCYWDRARWDVQATIGYAIWDNHFMDDQVLAGSNQGFTEPVFINTVRKNLKHKASAMQVAGLKVDVQLDSPDPERRKTAMVMEKLLSHYVDKYRLKRVLDEPNKSSLFVGEGSVFYYWNTRKISGSNITGVPVFEPISPINKYRDYRSRRADRSDSRFEFFVKKTTIADICDVYGVKQEDIIRTGYWDNAEEIPSFENLRDYSAHLVVMQEKVTYQYQAVVMDYRHEDSAYIFDYDDFKKEIIEPNLPKIARYKKVLIEDVTDEMIWAIMGIEEDVTDIGGLPSGLVAKRPIDAEFTGVYQYSFIPDSEGYIKNTLLDKPDYVGADFTLISIQGEYVHDEAYAFGKAYYEKDLLMIMSTLLTRIMLEVKRGMKRIPIFAPGAILNHGDFVKNMDDPDIIPVINPDWEPQYPGQQPMIWLNPPEIPQTITHFINKLELSIDDNMATPDVSRGANPDELSGRAIIAQQQAAQSGSRDSFFALEEAIIKLLERLAEDIARRTKHQQSFMVNGKPGEKLQVHVNPDEATAMDVQRNNDKQSQAQTQQQTDEGFVIKEIALTVPFADILNDMQITVQITDSEEIKNLMEQEKYEKLANRQMIAPDDYIRNVGVDNPETIIENLAKHNAGMMWAELTSQMTEEQQQQLYNIATQIQQGGAEETTTQTPPEDVANE